MTANEHNRNVRFSIHLVSVVHKPTQTTRRNDNEICWTLNEFTSSALIYWIECAIELALAYLRIFTNCLIIVVVFTFIVNMDFILSWKDCVCVSIVRATCQHSDKRVSMSIQYVISNRFKTLYWHPHHEAVCLCVRISYTEFLLRIRLFVYLL